MPYHNEILSKEKDGVVAPIGFHYMPDGTLMADAEHVAISGYLEKKITRFDINTKDISYLGETKTLTIRGDKGAIFSLEIYDDATIPNYYNFATKTWSTTKYGLYNIELIGSYTFQVKFPKIEFTDSTCDYNNDPTIAHDDDDGKIQAGMTVTGFGIPAGAIVSTITSDTAFELGYLNIGDPLSTTGGAVTNGMLTFGGLLKKYTIDLRAKTDDNVKTKHANYSEVRNFDNTINLNKIGRAHV